MPVLLPQSRKILLDQVPDIPLVTIPAGSIEMLARGGGPEVVQIKAFSMGRTEVTWDQYDPWCLYQELTEQHRLELWAVESDLPKHARSRPSQPYASPDRGFGHEGYPALSMTAHAAQLYCRWLSDCTGHRYRLPTEAEWEYACRAGGPPIAVTDRSQLARIAWFADNTAGETGDCQTRPVGRKEPNAWGIYDMLGNAAEWVIGHDGEPVLKGGSYLDRASRLTRSGRQPYDPSWQFSDPEFPKSAWWFRDAPFAGFRVVRED